MSNAPDRFLTWRWEEDIDAEDQKDFSPHTSTAKRLSYQKDSKRPNAGTFVLYKEDHTLGNLIRLQLLRDPSVRFAGYRMPHPLIFDCHIRVETMDAKLTPIQVFDSALEDLRMELDTLDKQFKDALAEYEHSKNAY